MTDQFTEDLTGFQDKRVRVTFLPSDGKTLAPAEGVVEAANNQPTKRVILLKVKGSQSAKLIFGFEIANIEVIGALDGDIKQSVLKPVKPSGVRRHLATSHGYYLDSVNKMTDDDAVELHENLHATHGGQIAHRHEGEAK